MFDDHSRIDFIHKVVEKIISHLKLMFVADKPPPPRLASQEVLVAAETSAEYFS
jgi:hypothetical protein